MSELKSAIASQNKRRLWLILALFFIVLPAACCLSYLLANVIVPILAELSVSAGGSENTGMIITMVIVVGGLLGFLLIPFGLLFLANIRQTKKLNEIFLPLGFTGKSYLISGWRYHGIYQGREVSVYIYRGPTIEIRIGTSVFTQAQVFPKDSITGKVADFTNKEPIYLTNPILSPVKVFAIDEPWTANFIEESSVAKAMVELLSSGANWALFRRVEITAGELVLYLYRSKKIIFFIPLTIEEIKVWFKNLHFIAAEADRMPSPEKTIGPSKLGSRETRGKMDRYVRIAMVVTILSLPLCVGLIGLIVYVLAVNYG